jgi:MPBQ/MSBQ methyltransferase
MAQLNDIYLSWMTLPFMREYYGGSNFFNVGLWCEGTRTAAEACDSLLERLLGFIPEKHGRVLDVACGLGGTTAHLARYYAPERVVAVDTVARTLLVNRQNAGGCHFGRMSATGLGLRDDTFDAVVCVEAAFHFNTRFDFLREAWRVLKPGGTLVVSDILFGRKLGGWRLGVPPANDIRTLEQYRGVYERAGFRDIAIEDVLASSWSPFREDIKRWAKAKRASGGLATPLYWVVVSLMDAQVAFYPLVAARK